MTADLTGALHFYEAASRYTYDGGFTAECSWQEALNFVEFSESDLLREAAWVVLCSGFRERVVREIFDYISLCFCDWESSATILQVSEDCRLSALSAFRNVRKIDALIDTAALVERCGFDNLKPQILRDPITCLQTLPYIGNVTSYHLAKNLGLDVAKPDRHLAAVASRFGYETADQLCREIATITGVRVSVVDLALWRFMAENGGAILRGQGPTMPVESYRAVAR
jgi:hypothetical protein